MTISPDKILATAVVAANVGAATLFPGDKLAAAAIAAVVSLPALTVVCFREALADTGFARGVPHASPVGLVGFIGWCMLLFFPLWFVYQSRLG
ncbi:MAG: hypothetical protein WD648_07435 [Planctomycetaceae bacterium]